MRMDAELRWIHAIRRRGKPGGCGPAVARIQSLISGHGLDGLLPYAAMGNLQEYALWAIRFIALNPIIPLGPTIARDQPMACGSCSGAVAGAAEFSAHRWPPC